VIVIVIGLVCFNFSFVSYFLLRFLFYFFLLLLAFLISSSYFSLVSFFLGFFFFFFFCFVLMLVLLLLLCAGSKLQAQAPSPSKPKLQVLKGTGKVAEGGGKKGKHRKGKRTELTKGNSLTENTPRGAVTNALRLHLLNFFC
jgi:hypothetical protein